MRKRCVRTQYQSYFSLDKLDFYDLIGASVIGIGILLMGLGIFNLGEDRKLIPLALGSAFATAGYSIIDGMGARLMGDAFAYVSWLLIFSAILYSDLEEVLLGKFFV